MKVNLLYMWFRVYESEVKSDVAKWDFLNQIREHMELTPKHERFFQEYAKKNNISVEAKESESKINLKS